VATSDRQRSSQPVQPLLAGPSCTLGTKIGSWVILLGINKGVGMGATSWTPHTRACHLLSNTGSITLQLFSLTALNPSTIGPFDMPLHFPWMTMVVFALISCPFCLRTT
jgi:hypothetical protein